MKLQQITIWSRPAVLAAAGLVLMGSAGCQTNVGGQTLPSPYYLQDDVQYFPAGPEDKIYNERRALEQYKAGVQQPAGPQALAPGGPPAGAAVGPAPGNP